MDQIEEGGIGNLHHEIEMTTQDCFFSICFTNIFFYFVDDFYCKFEKNYVNVITVTPFGNRWCHS